MHMGLVMHLVQIFFLLSSVTAKAYSATNLELVPYAGKAASSYTFDAEAHAENAEHYRPSCLCIQTASCRESDEQTYPQGGPWSSAPCTLQVCPIKTATCLLRNGCTRLRVSTCTCIVCTPLFVVSTCKLMGICATSLMSKKAATITVSSSIIPLMWAYVSCWPTRKEDGSDDLHRCAVHTDFWAVKWTSDPHNWPNFHQHETQPLLINH